MGRLRAWLVRLLGALTANRPDRELEAEIRSHLELHTDDNLRAGMRPDDARRAALLTFGGVEAIKDAYRDRRGLPLVEIVARDARHLARSLARNRGFTTVAVLTLALGIGANTAVFSVVNAVLVRPLPYPDPERLVAIRGNQSLPNLDDIRASSRSFEALGAVVTTMLNLEDTVPPVQLMAGLCNADLFAALRVRPTRGRLMGPDDDRDGAARVVLLSHGLWTSAFGGDERIIGRAITLSGQSYTVIGVLPSDSWVPVRQPDVWASLRVVNPVGARVRNLHFLETFLRLKPGVTLDAAQSEMRGIDDVLEREYPAENEGRHRVLVPLLDRMVGGFRSGLLALSGAVGLVLLVACANFAGLLLARATARHRELVIRASLGAGRGRLVGQMLTESVLISLLGGAAGLVLATWGVTLLPALTPPSLPRLSNVGIDGRVLGFAVGVSLLTGLICGVVPALSVGRTGVSQALKETGRGVAGGRSGLRLRRLLVVVQTALALVLLVCAGLLAKSFWLTQAVTPGFRVDNILTLRLALPEERYRDVGRQRQFREQLLASLDTIAGAHAAMISELPMSGESLAQQFIIGGRPPVPPGSEPDVQMRTVAGGYFRTLDIPLLRGRDFSPQDREGSPAVVVVNESFVREYLPNAEPLGATVRGARETLPEWKTIVGVVGDVRHFGLNLPDQPAIYDLYSQLSQDWKRWMYVTVRSDRAPSALVGDVQDRLAAIDKVLPVTRVKPMRDAVAASVDSQRFSLLLVGLFAMAALALAAIGIYGVMSFAVAQRSPEIGVRIALGADRLTIAWLVVSEGCRLTFVGTALGLVGALGATRWLSSELFGVSSHDPLTFAAVATALGAVALLASYVPAHRAMRVDPLQTLRSE